MAHRIIVAVLLACVLVLLGAKYGSARAQVLAPKAEGVRFELIANEPIAAPDHRSVVAGWSSLVFKDRRTGQCYVAFTEGGVMAMAAAPAGC